MHTFLKPLLQQGQKLSLRAFVLMFNKDTANRIRKKIPRQLYKRFYLNYLKKNHPEQYEMLKFFHADWYLRNNEDLRSQNIDPFEHFLYHGIHEDRDVHPFFDRQWYSQRYADVSAYSGTCFEHFLEYGLEEGRDPHPLFDSQWYRQHYPDVAHSKEVPFLHYLRHGAFELRDPHPLFYAKWYASQHMTARQVGASPLYHFLCKGGYELRDPNPYFQSFWYFKQLPEAIREKEIPLLHYLKKGHEEGYAPSADFDLNWLKMHDIENRLYVKNPLLSQCLSVPSRHKPRDAQSFSLLQEQQQRYLGSKQKIPAQTVVIGFICRDHCPEQIHKTICSAWHTLTQANLHKNASLLILHHGKQKLPTFPSHISLKAISDHSNLGWAAYHNMLMAEAFEQQQADTYITADMAGIFHPQSVGYLLRMQQAHQQACLVEALIFPQEHPKIYDAMTFHTPWASKTCLAISKKIYEKVGNFDNHFFNHCEDIDFSWRCQMAGFEVKSCPAAFFCIDKDHCFTDTESLYYFLSSNLMLAKKWRQDAFAQRIQHLMISKGFVPPKLNNTTSLDPLVTFADFHHQFTFAQLRWPLAII